MAITFACRGDSFDARYSSVGKTHSKYNSGNITTTSGGLSGTLWRFGTTAAGVMFIGRENLGTADTMSVLMRVAPRYTGAPAASRGYFYLGGNANKSAGLEMSHVATSGNLIISQRGTTGTLGANQVSAGAWSPTSGTFYDLVVTYDGTTNAGAIKVYVDASLLGSITPTQAWTSRPYLNVSELVVAMTNVSSIGNFDLDELVVWDSVITPSSVTLVSGTGSLNGASRTSLVSVSAFDGINSTDPGIANVRSGTSYTINGTSLTGTCAVPTAANTKTGVSVDATTGTYDGSDRWTDPDIANVRSGTAYKANSTSNNRTGTLDLPATSNVKTGVSFDGTSQTGTYDGSDRWTDPGVTNVRSGTAYKANSTTNNKTGTLAVPAASDVRNGTSVDAGTGTLDLPTEATVKVGVVYDNSTKTGTYDGSDRWTDPGEASVQVGVTYKANSTTTNKTGTYDGSDRWTDPGDSNVRSGTNYKANSTTNNKSGRVTVPTASQVKSAVTFDTDSGTLGTYDGSDRWSDPGVDYVALGQTYKANSTTANRTGTRRQPVETDVKAGVLYGPEDALIGTYDGSDSWSDPGEANVASGVTYEANGVLKTGTLEAVVFETDGTNIITTLTTNLRNAVGLALGNTYSALKYVADVKKNAFKGAEKRYGVQALGSNALAGALGYNTQEQVFEIVLTDSYIDAAGDSSRLSKAHNLQDRMVDIFKPLVKQRIGSSSLVLNVTDLNVGEPEYLEDDKVVVVRSKIKIIYRQSL